MVKNDIEFMDEISLEDIDQFTPEELKVIITRHQEERKELNIFVEEMALMKQNQKAGDIEWFMPTDKFTGVYRTMAEGINEQVGDHIGVKKQIVKIIRHFGDGDFSVEMEQLPGKKAFITHDVNQFRDRILDLFKTVEILTLASTDGKLSTRADSSAFEGDWKKLIGGINKMLDAILLPIGEGNRILSQISDGKIDELIVQTYQGDHERMKIAVNNVAIVLQDLEKEISRLTEASKQGLLSERGKPEKFKGAYADVIQGTNQMLDAILIPIGEGNRILAEIRGGNLRERVEISCQGDHEKMKNAINGVHAWLSELIQYITQIANGDMTAEMGKASDKDQIHEHLIRMRENIKALVSDTNMLSQAAVEGKLSTRADATKHQGDFQKIVKGVNDTLDSVILPVKEALRVSKSYANYQF
ncbi:MAG: hypothetical protein V1862_12180, partial [Methanobacteriota archaeon]